MPEHVDVLPSVETVAARCGVDRAPEGIRTPHRHASNGDDAMWGVGAVIPPVNGATVQRLTNGAYDDHEDECCSVDVLLEGIGTPSPLPPVTSRKTGTRPTRTSWRPPTAYWR